MSGYCHGHDRVGFEEKYWCGLNLSFVWRFSAMDYSAWTYHMYAQVIYAILGGGAKLPLTTEGDPVAAVLVATEMSSKWTLFFVTSVSTTDVLAAVMVVLVVGQATDELKHDRAPPVIMALFVLHPKSFSSWCSS